MAFSDSNPTPSAEQVNQAHTNSDVDKSRLSQHHTLGTSATQASPGNHNHDGITSVKIKATDIDGDIAAANGLPAGGDAGQILAKDTATDYDAIWIDNFTGQVKHEVKLGQNIAKGQAVYVSSSNGTNMIVSKASNTTDATSSKTLGLLETGGVTNDFVMVITEGLLAGLDTSTATAGDPVWLGTSGNLLFGTANKPVAPAHLVYLGVVTRVQSVNGEIFVHIVNGFELDELHDVLISSKTNGDLIKYDSASGLWKNAAQSTLTIAPSQVTGTAVITSDSRLSDARTPTAHASTHASGGSDQITIAPSQVTGTAVITSDSRLSDARTPTAHASTHASGGSDPVTVAQSQVTGLTTALSGKASTTHSATHMDGGSDPVYIEQAQVTNLISDLSNKASSTHVHGNISNSGAVTTNVTATNPVKVLITNSSNAVGTLTTTGASTTTFLRGDGTWSTPAGSSSLSATAPITYNSGTGVIAITNASTTTSGAVTTGSQTFDGIKSFGVSATPGSGGVKIVNGGVFDYNGFSTSTGTTTLSNVPGSVGNITTPSLYINVNQPGATTATSSVGAEFRASTAASRTYLITFSAAAALQGSISTLSNATTYSTSSDYRMKENIVPMSNNIERLMALKPSRFNFIEYPETLMDGFIAHEVQEVIPEAVVGDKDEVNEDGSPAYQGIDQSKMVPLLTAALQEAILKIEALETRLDQLENK